MVTVRPIALTSLLVARAPVTFTWEFSGSLQWNPENASLGLELGAGIFSRGPDLFIHSIGWGISFVDGPVNMGDFSGKTVAPLGITGEAGAPGLFRADLPAAPWDGRGSVQATTWIASPDNPYHLGPESLPAMVAQIREAAGPSGRNIDYVLKLAATLDDLGIVDPHVAEIARALQAHGG